MNSDCSPRAKEISLQAFRLSEADRAAFLDEACSGNAELRAEVDHLLACGAVPCESTQDLRAEFLASQPGDSSGVRPDGTSPEAPADRSPLDHWGKLTLRSRLGTGAFGEVFLAFDPDLDREVALKLYRRVADRDALLKEGRLLARVRHSNVIVVHGAEEHDGRFGLWMDHIRGCTLRDFVRRQGRLGPQEAALIGLDVCRALAAVHAAGLIHQDVKAQNVMREEGGRIVLMDFGVGAEVEPSDSARASGPPSPAPASSPPSLSGTPAYMAPEKLLRGVRSVQTDVYALGVLLYYMVSGRFPIEGHTLTEIVDAHRSGRRTLLRDMRSDLPGAFIDIVERALAPEPAQRFHSMGEMERALAAFIGQTEGAAAPPAKGRFGTRRRWIPWGVAGIATAVAAFWWMAGHRGIGPEPASSAFPYLVVEDFRNLSADSSGEYLALGLTEAVRTQLASLDGIQVVQPKDNTGVKLALEGAIQRSGDQLRLSYKLVDRSNGIVLSASMVEGAIAALFTLQDQVTQAAGRALAVKFGLPSPTAAQQAPTADVSAYDYYLQARGYLQRPADQENLQIAADLFRHARQRDEHFTLALAGLGEAYWKLFEETKDPAWVGQAEELSREALAEDPSLAEVHITLGTIYQGTGRYPQAAEAFERARQIDVQSVPAYIGLARAYMALGQMVDAEKTFLEAIRRRPGDWRSHSQLGAFYASQNRTAEAVKCFQSVVDLTPDNARGFSNLGAVLLSAERHAEAIAALERSIALEPNYRAFTNLGTAYRYEGRYADAVRSYQQALALDPRDYRVWGNLASTYALVESRPAEADSAWAQALKLVEELLLVNPNDAVLHASRARFLAATGRHEEARREIERALALAPDRGEVLFWASAVYESVNDREAALDAVGRAIAAGTPVQMWQKEPSLKSLVSDPHFARIVAETDR